MFQTPQRTTGYSCGPYIHRRGQDYRSLTWLRPLLSRSRRALRSQFRSVPRLRGSQAKQGHSLVAKQHVTGPWGCVWPFASPPLRSAASAPGCERAVGASAKTGDLGEAECCSCGAQGISAAPGAGEDRDRGGWVSGSFARDCVLFHRPGQGVAALRRHLPQLHLSGNRYPERHH